MWSRVGHRVLLRSERSVLSRSKKRTLRSFPFFFRVFRDLWNPKERYVLFRSFQKNGKERKERNVLFKRTEKNAKNVTFFWKERKRTRERNVLCKWILERNVLCYVLFLTSALSRTALSQEIKLYLQLFCSKKERNVLPFFLQKNETFSRSFCKRTKRSPVLFRSLQKNGTFFPFFSVLCKRTLRSFHSFPFFRKERKRT